MTSYYVIDKPQRTSHWHTGFKIHINEGRMRTDELVVFSTYHLDNSRNIDVNTPKTKSKRKQNKKKKQVKKKQNKKKQEKNQKKNQVNSPASIKQRSVWNVRFDL